MNEASESVRFAARLSLHEFLLEQLYANAMLSVPDNLSAWDAFSTDLMNSIRTKAFATTLGNSDLLAIQAVAIALAENFAAKVRERIQRP